MIVLKPMIEAEFQYYKSIAVIDYAKEKVTAGSWSEDEAEHLSEIEFARLLPGGEKTELQHLFSVYHEDQVVGMIWIAQASSTNLTEGFIYDFIIYELYRGRGYGEQTMKEIEVAAKQLGIKKIRLHVFGHNLIARGLYEKMGYGITDLSMSKSI